MKESFFKNKRVLITGHTGFKGSWLTLWLDALGADVVGFSLNPPSNPYLHRFLDFDNKVTDIRGDIRKPADVFRAIRDYEPELVFHLAAQPILRTSYERPADTYMTNAMGTLNLLEAIRKFGNAKAVVNVTTDKVYSNTGKKHAYREDERLGSSDPYSSSKAVSELITQTYKDSFLSNIGITTARAGNVLGGGDWGKYRIIPYLFSSQTMRRTLIIRKTDKDDVRPWTYVFDVLNGYLTLGERLYKHPLRYCGAWNFGAAYVKTVMDLIKEFSQYWRIRYRIEESTIQEAKILLLNSTKSRKMLDWKPLVSFKEGVKETADWYTNFHRTHHKGVVSQYSLKQLNSFRKRLHE